MQNISINNFVDGFIAFLFAISPLLWVYPTQDDRIAWEFVIFGGWISAVCLYFAFRIKADE